MKIKKITLLICGSIALSRSKSIYELLLKDFRVNLIFTNAARKIFINEYKDESQKVLELESLEKFSILQSDSVVIYAATYNTLNKLAQKYCDNDILQDLVAFKNKIIIAPAMNNNMYTSEIMQANLKLLEAWKNVTIVDPIIGRLREGHYAIGHIASNEEIWIITKLQTSNLDLSNKHIVIASGAMQVNLNKNLKLTNLSSSTFAHALVKVLYSLNAKITWIDNSKKNVRGVSKVIANTNLEMIEQSCKYLKNDSYYFSLTAGSDFKVEQSFEDDKQFDINFGKNLKIITNIQSQLANLNIHYIGFKLSVNTKPAIDILNKYNLDYVLWNDLHTISSPNIKAKLISKYQTLDFEDTKLATSYQFIQAVFGLKNN